MGQRHQVFLIARVAAHNAADTAARYRCVGAYHHQWCYGRLPLIAARRFITLVKQKDNAEIIREQLQSIQGKYGLGKTEPHMPAIPCPYPTFLVSSAFCIDLEAGHAYGSGVSFQNSVLDANMGSGDGDNNDGITVFDITDPTNPAYCFVCVGGLEGEVAVGGWTPLTAEQYVRAYYPVPNEKQKEREGVKETEEDVQKRIDALSGERLMTLDMLAEAWPHEYSAAPNPTKDTAASNSSTAVPSLADLTLRPAVEHAIKVGETEELEGLVWMPGKADHMKSVLRSQVSFPDSGLSLLAKVLEHEAGSTSNTIDLSGLALSDSQIHSLLPSTGADKIELLNLSHNPNFTVDILRTALTLYPKLRRLVLLSTAISDEQIHQLLVDEPKLFYSIEELVHPAFLSWQNDVCYPVSFAYVGIHGYGVPSSACLATFTPASVVQSLTDLLSPLAELGEYEMYGLLGTSLAPQVAFASGVRGEGESWQDRRVHCFPAFNNAPFSGKGWLFVGQWETMSQSGCRYGFVQTDLEPDPPRATIYDLAGFLKEMAAEGRPPAAESAVNKLEKIFVDLEQRQEAKLWTEPEFVTFTGKFTMYNMRRY
ncbi:hypothetical protein B0H16DRAFT_617226 [Mycena metata]|uniref:Uncharacterized protein n=1 Tax=Mycena metata TaxID=1033252 RepID=A0AAD7NZ43_9AGAR|nr:hypothetical protein B0H16DRAFT_617226 [Mycena metata]